MSNHLSSPLKAADAELAQMKQATVVRWRKLEAGLGAATAHLPESVAAAVG